MNTDEWGFKKYKHVKQIHTLLKKNVLNTYLMNVSALLCLYSTDSSVIVLFN